MEAVHGGSAWSWRQCMCVCVWGGGGGGVKPHFYITAASLVPSPPFFLGAGIRGKVYLI